MTVTACDGEWTAQTLAPSTRLSARLKHATDIVHIARGAPSKRPPGRRRDRTNETQVLVLLSIYSLLQKYRTYKGIAGSLPHIV